MKKFSYAVEFYRRNLFDFENVELFERKVKEAEDIEKILNTAIFDLDVVRKYVLRSYQFNKKYNKIARLKYIKGFIYADSIIDSYDISEFAEYLENNLSIVPKMSLWRNKGYIQDLLEEDFLEDEFKDDSLNMIEYVNFDFYDDLSIDDIEEDDLELEEDFNVITENPIEDDFEYMSSDFVPITVQEKLNIFKKNKNKIINEIVKRKKISKEDEYMIKRGIRTWLNYCLYFLDVMLESKINCLKLSDENISKYL